MKKAEFIENCLEPMLTAINPCVDKCNYFITETNEEFVEIIFVDGGKYLVCVTGDTNAATVVDVLKQIFL